MKNMVISVFAVLAVFLTSTFGFTQTLPSARLENIFGSLEHEVVIMPWGSSLSRIAVMMGRESQKQISEFVDEIMELNKGNSCLKSRDLVWENCEIKVPSYPAREVQIRFAAANVVNDALANDAKMARAELTQAQTKKQGLIVFLIAAAIIIFVLVCVLVFVRPRSQTDQKELELEKEKNKRLEEDKTLADEEIKRLMAESNGLVEKVNMLYTEKDRLEAALRQKVAVGDTIELESREHGKIAFKIHEVLCPEEQCQTPLKPPNALSHYFKQHGTSQDNKPDGFKE